MEKKRFNGVVGRFNTIDHHEINAVSAVMRRGVLSDFVGAEGAGFYGGEWVRKLESKFEEYFHVANAVAVNSWTSGLICLLRSSGLKEGDEVITTPWTMAATATAIVHAGATPRFADIDPSTFNLSADSVREQINERTKGIVAVDIFGLCADAQALEAVAIEYDLFLYFDSAQSPGAKLNGKFAGTFANGGGFSLNYHKHIQCGEGGVIVCESDELAQNCRLLRNHGEVAFPDSASKTRNMAGYNFRMGELEAAIGYYQLDKLESIVLSKRWLAVNLAKRLNALEGLRVSDIHDERNVYYVFPITIDAKISPVSRDRLHHELTERGVPGVFKGYQNIHKLPIFSRTNSSSKVSETDVCPNAEFAHESSFLGLNLCCLSFSASDIEQVAEIFEDIWASFS